MCSSDLGLVSTATGAFAAGFAGIATFDGAAGFAGTATFVGVAAFAGLTAFAGVAAFTVAVALAVVTVLLVATALPAGVAGLAGVFVVFGVPLPLVLAVALFTGAGRETVLDAARDALAEVAFGIARPFYRNHAKIANSEAQVMHLQPLEIGRAHV